MDTIELDISDPDQLPEAAEKVLQLAGDVKIFLIEGEMGAGKTTFIKQLCKTLWSEDSFSSPTYSIVNEYHSPKGKIYHFDLYRIQNPNELLDIGFEEYMNSNNYCFIEWPFVAKNLIGEKNMNIKIEVKEGKRKLTIVKKNSG